MTGNILPKPSADVTNTAIATNTFPYKAKRTSVTSVDKIGNDKHVHTNYI